MHGPVFARRYIAQGIPEVWLQTDAGAPIADIYVSRYERRLQNHNDTLLVCRRRDGTNLALIFITNFLVSQFKPGATKYTTDPDKRHRTPTDCKSG